MRGPVLSLRDFPFVAGSIAGCQVPEFMRQAFGYRLQRQQAVGIYHAPSWFVCRGRRGLIRSNWEPTMSTVQVEQTSYQMPPHEGITIAHFLTVADVERSAQFYETVFDGQIVRKGEPTYIRIANTWLIVNIGGGPTPDKPSVTLRPLADQDEVSSFMNIRVADIQACYRLWRSRGAQFLTEPKDKVGETRCYIRDPDGYIIEVGESKPDAWG